MKNLIRAAILLIILSGISVFAQDNKYYSGRLDSLTSQLKRATVDLADRAQNDILRGYSNSRSDLDAAFLAQQMDAAAGLFQQMVRDRRSATELRDAASILYDISRRGPSYGSSSYQWRDVQNAVGDISRELGSTNGGGNPPYETPVKGRFTWKGTVDDKVRLTIKDTNIELTTLSGTPYNDATYNFKNALPNSQVKLEINKKKGRGSAKVIQQPSAGNGFTAIVEISDSDGGAKEYELEMYWR